MVWVLGRNEVVINKGSEDGVSEDTIFYLVEPLQIKDRFHGNNLLGEINKVTGYCTVLELHDYMAVLYVDTSEAPVDVPIYLWEPAKRLSIGMNVIKLEEEGEGEEE